MIEAELPDNETQRLEALDSYQIMDTLPEQDFDDLTNIAASICQTPISLVSLIDEHRQWFKSDHGLGASETPRELAFCAHAILEPNELFEVPDALKDERFHNNPLVADKPDVRFYAGMPLVNSQGFALGTLCVIDHKPRNLTKEQKSALESLARQVVGQMELRRKIHELEASKKQVERLNEELEQFAYVASHDLKTPLRGIHSLATWLKEEYEEVLGKEGMEYINLIHKRTNSLQDLIEGILSYSKSGSLREGKTSIDTRKLVEECISNCAPPKEFSITLEGDFPMLQTHPVALQQVFQNLISNAIKYNDKELPLVVISCEQTETKWQFFVKDNGPGIEPAFHDRIFTPFQTLERTDRFGEKGSGVGLATVKKIVENLGGDFTLTSTLGQGACFILSLPKS